MNPARFRSWVLGIVSVYVAIQFAYLPRRPIVMDEFDGAYDVYRLREDVPYRDFTPYKTVLGYYLQVPATFAASSVWGRLMALKMEMIVINAVLLAMTAFYCARFLNARVVILALALLAASTPMLERSSDIRVDMLTAWAGLWSFLFLVRRRYALAGFLVTISFAVSQKAALYVLASNAMLVAAIYFDEDRRRAIRGFLIFNIASAVSLAGYLAFWSLIASPAAVLQATFVSALRPASAHGYTIRWQYWSQVLTRDFMFLLLAVAGIATLLFRKNVPSHLRGTAVYAAALLAQCAFYGQPWPYFFVLLFAPLVVLLAAFFDQLQLPWPRYLIAACVLFGIIYPLHRLAVIWPWSSDYQKYNVALASSLLGPGETYLAANDIVHDHEQAPRRLARLDGLRIHELQTARREHHEAIVREMIAAPPKLVIGTYRTFHLPEILTEHIARNYARLSGSVRLYAPLIEPAQSRVSLAYGGRYRIEMESAGSSSINGNAVSEGALVALDAGAVSVTTTTRLRLRLLPAGIEELVDPRYAAEQQFYDHVYE